MNRRALTKMDLGHQITEILEVKGDTYAVKLRYADNQVGWVSLHDIFENPSNLVSEVLKGQIFEKCFVSSGALAWPNGLEFCPDMLRMRMKKKPDSAA